jgi:hypothetical protein
MSLKLEKEAFALPLDDPTAKLLLVAMCHLSANGEVYASRLTLRRMTGMNDRSISRKRNLLLEKNYLKRIEYDHYFINLGKETELAEKDTMSIQKDTMSIQKDTMSIQKDTMSIPLYKNGTNGMNGTALLKILDIELKKLYHRKKEHPGNPDIPNAVERDHPDRLAYWELDALGKKIQKKMDAELLQLAS